MIQRIPDDWRASNRGWNVPRVLPADMDRGCRQLLVALRAARGDLHEVAKAYDKSVYQVRSAVDACARQYKLRVEYKPIQRPLPSATPPLTPRAAPPARPQQPQPQPGPDPRPRSPALSAQQRRELCDLLPDVELLESARRAQLREARSPGIAVTCKALMTALRQADWNVTAAAHALGIARSTMYETIRRCRVDIAAQRVEYYGRESE